MTPLLDRNHGKAFVDAQDRNGDTALHIASRHGHRRVIKELQRRKANQHIKNNVSFVIMSSNKNSVLELSLF